MTMKNWKYIIPFVVIILFALPLVAQNNKPQLLVIDFGWDDDEGCWYAPAPIHENERFMVRVWDYNMTMRIPNATIIFATHTGEYNITKTDEYGKAYFTAPDTEEKMERCVLYVSADGYANTSRFTYIHNQGIWKTKCIATSSTVDVNGRTKLFNVSRYWKIEYEYVAKHDDSAIRIIVRRPDGHLLSYYLLCDVERSEGIIYCKGALRGIQLDIFAGRIQSWTVKVFDHA